jgi:hypothetical protein
MLCGILTLTACSTPKTVIKYVDKPYEIKVPVKCIVNDANCTFKRDTYTEVLNSYVECIVNMKKNEEVCK